MNTAAASYTLEIAYHVVCWEKTKLGHVGTKVGEFLCEDAAAGEVKRLNSKTMIEDFSIRTGIAIDDILGSSRRAEIVAVRQLYWKFLHDNAGFSKSQIANLCDVSHVTVIHGIRAARERLEVGDKMACRLWNLVKDVEV